MVTTQHNCHYIAVGRFNKHWQKEDITKIWRTNYTFWEILPLSRLILLLCSLLKQTVVHYMTTQQINIIERLYCCPVGWLVKAWMVIKPFGIRSLELIAFNVKEQCHVLCNSLSFMQNGKQQGCCSIKCSYHYFPFQ